MNPHNPNPDNALPGAGQPLMQPLPPYAPFVPQPTAFPLQPPPTGMPLFPPVGLPTMPGLPPMPAPPPMQTVYPPGQGPLADRPTAVGTNGLLQAPELDEGPEPHEAQQYVKLNPGETAQYLQYWSEASDGEESLAGPHAVQFLSRASKVSKGQLRKIWDVADHRKDGALDQAQFFIALRLIALAQRGAELSVAGLRNFTGINLIPSIDPPPKPPTPPPPAEDADVIPSNIPNQTSPAQQETATTPQFSWVIPAEVAQRFDNFFNSLSPNGGELLDAATVVPFLTKSGLPRPTLKKIWQLADVGRDGKLSRDEFRIAMHLVTAIRNQRVIIEDLPEALDPSGPNWLRVQGEDPPTPPIQPQQDTSASLPPPQNNTIPPPPPPPQHQIPRSPALTSGSDTSVSNREAPIVLAPPPPSPPSSHLPTASQAAATPVPSPAVSTAEMEKEREERRQMLDMIRMEREEMERARREMEAMRSEMDRLRMENASLASERRDIPATSTAPTVQTKVQMPVPAAQPVTVTSDKPTNASGMQRATPPAGSANINSGVTVPAMATAGVPPMLAQRLGVPANSGGTGIGVEKANLNANDGVLGTTVVSDAVSPEKGAGAAGDDDDIWDQPSPKASAMPGPTGGQKRNSASDDDASSDDDDDDDFWGGMGPKPTLGSSGVRKAGENLPAAAQGVGKGFGGSELDDWML